MNTFYFLVSESPELSQNPYVEVTESTSHVVQTHGTSTLQNSQARLNNRWKIAYYYLWKDFKSAYTNPYVVKWSFWFALSTCGFLQACVLQFKLIWHLKKKTFLLWNISVIFDRDFLTQILSFL
jgi:hypothetical protein